MGLKKNKTLLGFIIGVVLLVFQHGVYLLANEIAKLIGVTPFSPKIDAIDNLFPIVSIFVIIYIWSYFYWALTPMMIIKCEKSYFKNFIAFYILACFIGGLILTFAPTYMDRVAEGLYSAPDNNVFDKLLKFWYSLDGGKMAYNLSPSFHCMNSTVCLLAVYKRNEIPKWYKIYSLIITILIYLSTLFVKQHFFMDVISGILVAFVSYIICMKFDIGNVIFNRRKAK